MTNTRIKDYFDLRVLLNDRTLDSAKIRRAIEATFERRKMPMPTMLPVGFADVFAANAIKQTQWNAFLKKNRLETIALADVVNRLRSAFHAQCYEPEDVGSLLSYREAMDCHILEVGISKANAVRFCYKFSSY